MVRNLKDFRTESGISQAEASRPLNCSQAAYSHIESGNQPFRVDQALRLSDVLEPSARDLFVEHTLWTLDEVIRSMNNYPDEWDDDDLQRFLGPIMVALLCWPDCDPLNPMTDSELADRLETMRDLSNVWKG